MNGFIEYFYNLNNITTMQKENSYIFNYKNYTYSFSILERTPEELYEIARFTSQYSFLDVIIKNKDNKLVTKIYDKMYILTKKNNYSDNLLTYILEPKYVINFDSILDKSNWVELWSRKIDNIEYQLSHIINKFPLLCNSVNYYIGLAENGISYIRKISGEISKKTISHIRISDDGISNLQNIIIDNEARDISEYLKYIFIVKRKEYRELARKVLQVGRFNSNTLMYIYGRMFFLTFFFDQYDRIINNSAKEQEIESIVNRAEEYEDYIIYIYELISMTKKIPNVDWI